MFRGNKNKQGGVSRKKEEEKGIKSTEMFSRRTERSSGKRRKRGEENL